MKYFGGNSYIFAECDVLLVQSGFLIAEQSKSFLLK